MENVMYACKVCNFWFTRERYAFSSDDTQLLLTTCYYLTRHQQSFSAIMATESVWSVYAFVEHVPAAVLQEGESNAEISLGMRRGEIPVRDAVKRFVIHRRSRVETWKVFCLARDRFTASLGQGFFRDPRVMWRAIGSMPRDWVCVDWNVPTILVSLMPYSLSHVLDLIFTVYADEHPFEFFNEEQREAFLRPPCPIPKANYACYAIHFKKSEKLKTLTKQRFL